MSRIYYIFSNGRMKRQDNTIYLENEYGEKKSIPIEDVDHIHIFGEMDMNTKLMNFLSQNGVMLHFYNYYGYYAGSFMPRRKNVSGDLTVKQVQNYLNKQKRLYIAYQFIDSAVFHILRNLRNYDGVEEFISDIEKERNLLNGIQSIQELMGIEGRIRNIYYQAFNVFLRDDFKMEKREMNPPSNPINALISFGNSLMYQVVLSEIYHTQLDPTISFLHEPSERRYSLSLDISEIFKPLIVDPIIFKLINNRVLTLDDFDEDLNYCYLKEDGRKKFIKEFDDKLKTTIMHRKLKRKLSYRGFIRQECYKLIKHLLGDEDYKPLKAWW
ncbi:type I-B CRISPR-associated endonuclease Cas1b [Thermoanaerobacterium thermosaccharolyticum]|jgi:CRISP-associated protein Cas1|uniref:type I-B CRISPR-associated endonuclease Cas1b n=1 Tax=Thermoanaerobacterium thermosaccharolyticum TaxID=1517 RepID=UPI0017858803|nr:type I-B CRISPR-associated endonuclease Cas1b [Thermoanaerobacterium thermosaccharolyticum]MBE0069220.1 type I-B CRISPR-associated endonuclease Cas1 [Thermoanaerobacterium thermosaccharolyticum]MBE0228108.1 type I-B CRISPR-associated endonuclease Cas1 [Thermoanaerobacterium thermosaccharolyticum]